MQSSARCDLRDTRFVRSFVLSKVVQYTEEQIRRVEESIRIRRELEPVELVRAVLPMDNSFKKFRMFFVLID